ncbi:MAG: hypothetical protein VW405_08210, partial [Rhodospirillaceae bacterium]
IFTLMDDVGRFFWFLFGRFIGPTDEYDADEPRSADANVRAAMVATGAGGVAAATAPAPETDIAPEKKDDAA